MVTLEEQSSLFNLTDEGLYLESELDFSLDGGPQRHNTVSFSMYSPRQRMLNTAVAEIMGRPEWMRKLHKLTVEPIQNAPAIAYSVLHEQLSAQNLELESELLSFFFNKSFGRTQSGDKPVDFTVGEGERQRYLTHGELVTIGVHDMAKGALNKFRKTDPEGANNFLNTLSQKGNALGQVVASRFPKMDQDFHRVITHNIGHRLGEVIQENGISAEGNIRHAGKSFNIKDPNEVSGLINSVLKEKYPLAYRPDTAATNRIAEPEIPGSIADGLDTAARSMPNQKPPPTMPQHWNN